jgi:uncharacterized membrane protein YebE (DUF533 family)
VAFAIGTTAGRLTVVDVCATILASESYCTLTLVATLHVMASGSLNTWITGTVVVIHLAAITEQANRTVAGEPSNKAIATPSIETWIIRAKVDGVVTELSSVRIATNTRETIQ